MPTPQGGTETGVANGATGVDSTDAPGSTTRQDAHLTARERALASMDAQILAQREADHAAALAEGNPLALAMEAERLGVRQEDESFEAQTSPRAPVVAPKTRRLPEVSGMEDEPEDPTPTQPLTPVAAAPRKAASRAAPTASADPLASYIVMQNGQPMVRLQVDGKEALMPLERARAQLQKAGAAEARLQQATEARKQLERDRAALAVREAAITVRERTQPSAALPADADPALQSEAKELVKSLMSDTPDEATTKLTRVLSRMRQGPVVDVAAIEQRAVAAAKQGIREEQAQQDIVEGFTEFQRDYPEIAGSPRLFKLADNLSDEIKTEHPNWTPSQIMAEAGKQTREWLAELTGGAVAPTPVQKPALAPAANNRQLAKQNLRPMPVVRAVRREEGVLKENAPPAPADVLAEIRRSRGQAA